MSDEKDKINDAGKYSFHSPKIMAIINNKRYAALVDTGASASACSEVLYNSIIRSGANLIAMPFCGLYCSTAIGHSKKRVRFQCMIPIKIGDKVLEIIFLVIPNLISDLILGCDFLSEWKASVDFERCILLIKNGMGELITPFIKEEMREVISNNVSKEELLLEETFFVECIGLQETSIARVWNVSDKHYQIPLCSHAHDCEECSNKLNGNYINLCPDTRIEHINECIRLSQINTTEVETYDHIMKAEVISTTC